MGYDVTVGQLQAGEIDFVCTKKAGMKRVYIQASYVIYDEITRKREFGNLRDINDNYPKYVISMTPLLSQNDDNGITHLHLRKFLMMDSIEYIYNLIYRWMQKIPYVFPLRYTFADKC